jgi:cytochrome b
VALVAAAYVTWRLNWMDWHALAGDALLALLFFRLLWGVLGSDTARFSRFLVPPRSAARHLVGALRHEPDRQAGHNPAGGWMVVLLLALLLGETLTGLYVDNDVAVEGPLTELVPARIADLVTTLHTVLWQALLATVTRLGKYWISANRDGIFYEFNRQDGTLTYASSTTQDGITTTIVGSGQCAISPAPIR